MNQYQMHRIIFHLLQQSTHKPVKTEHLYLKLWTELEIIFLKKMKYYKPYAIEIRRDYYKIK